MSYHGISLHHGLAVESFKPVDSRGCKNFDKFYDDTVSCTCACGALDHTVNSALLSSGGAGRLQFFDSAVRILKNICNTDWLIQST
jgi:hypothetical protein